MPFKFPLDPIKPPWKIPLNHQQMPFIPAKIVILQTSKLGKTWILLMFASLRRERPRSICCSETALWRVPWRLLDRVRSSSEFAADAVNLSGGKCSKKWHWIWIWCYNVFLIVFLTFFWGGMGMKFVVMFDGLWLCCVLLAKIWPGYNIPSDLLPAWNMNLLAMAFLEAPSV